MIKYELQFFGGRDSGGSRNSGGGGGTSKELGPEDSAFWSEDPSLIQGLADPERRESVIDQLDEDGYELDEIRDYIDTANMIRDLAESETVKGVSTLYRGERMSSLEAAQAKYKVGAEIPTTQLTPYATNSELATSYATMYGKGTAVVITNTSKAGNFVGLRTQHYGEAPGKGEEIIVPKGVKSKVIATRYDKKNNILHVTMENSATPKKKKK